METPICNLIRQRYSCRRYDQTPLRHEEQRRIGEHTPAALAVPFGADIRIPLVAAHDEDRQILKGLGTYGFIQGAPGFLIGAVRSGDRNLEDFGWAMEALVLQATEMGLGTCWLGGSFRKSGFARRIALQDGEQIPAVAAIGHVQDPERERRAFSRRSVGALQRFGWESLFFNQKFGLPLTKDAAGEYALALEMLRLGPSASNKQPWRVVRDGAAWHFYLRRTPGYPGRLVKNLLQIDDLQRVDMGIAMYHFSRTAQESGLMGAWVIEDPGLERPDALTEYSASWVEMGAVII